MRVQPLPGCGGGGVQCGRVRDPGAVAHSPKRLESELTWIEEHTGGKPYGVDVLLPPKYIGAEQGGIDAQQARELIPEGHRTFVDDLLVRYGIPAVTDRQRSSSAGGLHISPKGYQPLLDVAFAHDIRLIASALGPPPPDLVERAHNHDVLVAALAGTAQHARRHAAAGVDLIVAQGTEAGGHTGEVATMVLVPEVVDAVSPTPVLAAGGSPVAARSLRRWPWGGRRLVRVGLVDHRRSRNAPGGQGQVSGRNILGHGAVPVANRQAGAHAAHGLDRRMGSA